MTERELERALEAAEKAHQDAAERTLKAWRKVSEGAVREVTRLKEVLAELANSEDPANDVNNVRAIQKELRHLNELRAKAHEAGYTSLALALKAIGQQKKTNLPPLYNVAPTQWVQAATLKRVREGLKERVYKVPEVTPVRAQTLLKTVRPLLEQLYEMWEDEANRAEVEEAYKTLDYDSFVTSLHKILFETVAGVSEVEEETVVAQTPIPTEDELLSLVSGKGIDYGVGTLD